MVYKLPACPRMSDGAHRTVPASCCCDALYESYITEWFALPTYVPVQLYTVLATSIHFCRTQYSCTTICTAVRVRLPVRTRPYMYVRDSSKRTNDGGGRRSRRRSRPGRCQRTGLRNTVAIWAAPPAGAGPFRRSGRGVVDRGVTLCEGWHVPI
jgi:hypothetical protein